MKMPRKMVSQCHEYETKGSTMICVWKGEKKLHFPKVPKLKHLINIWIRFLLFCMHCSFGTHTTTIMIKFISKWISTCWLTGKAKSLNVFQRKYFENYFVGKTLCRSVHFVFIFIFEMSSFGCISLIFQQF